MDNDLDGILNGTNEAPTEAQPAAVEAAPEAEVEAVAAEPEAKADGVDRVPKGEPGAGQFKSKDDPKGEEAAPPAAEEESATAPVGALKAERSKRQAAEERERAKDAELERLRADLERFRQPQPAIQPQPSPAQVATEQAPPDRWDDPEGYDRWLVDQATKRATETARAEAYQTFQYQRFASSAEEMKSKLPDYAEKIGVFEQMLQHNPALLDELYRAPNPAEYAYNTAKIQVEISECGGLDGLINARVQAALQGQAAQTPTPAPAPIPSTLADAQSARGSAAGASSGPLSLDQILKG
jgi:hypothetical protein